MSYNWDYDLLDHKGNLLGHLESASGLTVSAPDLKQAELLVKAHEYSGRPADLIRDMGGVVPPEFDNEHLRGL